MTIVRAYRPADRPAVLALNAGLQEHERALRPSRLPGAAMTKEYVRSIERMLGDPQEDAALFVTEADGRVTGFATCCVDEDELEEAAAEVLVRDLVVDKAFRGHGIARALLAEVDRFAAARGIGRVVTSVLIENGTARAAYSALGFRPAALTLERAVRNDTA